MGKRLINLLNRLLLNPRMHDCFFSAWAFCNIISQQLGDKVFCTLTDIVPYLIIKVELSNFNGFHDFLIRSTVKWRNSRKYNESDDSC